MYPKYRSTLIACARWENPYIKEWIYYHIQLGFDSIFLVCNDDDPSGMRAVIDGLDTVTRKKIFFRAFKGQGLQSQMYLDILPLAQIQSDWICILDIDEFIVLKKWDSISDLLNFCEAEAVTGLYFNWVNYGPNGYDDRPSGSVIELYNKRSRFVNPHTKHISRSECFNLEKINQSSFPFWHGLNNSFWKGYARINVLGINYANAFDDFPNSMLTLIKDSNEQIINTAYIAHFSFKSNNDAIIRFERGIGGNFSGQAQWVTMGKENKLSSYIDSLNEIEDDYLKKKYIINNYPEI